MRRNCLLRFLAATLCAVVFSSAVAAAQAQEPPVKPAPAGTDEARIVAQLIAKETAFQRAFAGYSFEREAIIQSIGMGRQVTGEYFRRSRISFDPQGVMRERVIKMPVPGLAPSQTDIDDLNTIQLFVLESAKLARYDFKLAGTQEIDGTQFYVFDVQPKVMPNAKKSKERFFQGRVWIDTQDLLLVKARGKGVPAGKEVFPTFDYYREHDGRSWLPSTVFADDELELKSGAVVRVRIRVKYRDYDSTGARQ
ncbi:MAG: hypothetical protein ABR554_11390 [Pyrinomonadaceae bacterium]